MTTDFILQPYISLMTFSDYALSENSKVCIITAGARQREGEDRLSLGKRNVAIFQSIVPQLVKYSPETILMVVTNPGVLIKRSIWKRIVL